ncbi:LysR family transcriptional regulator [Achromobacter anxifer]|jgi:DNA-binding transcriptional LysR family regulator|uniref:HTH-type transcriptional regulator DmlR n=1 Tax=Achromobacter anxifer TaxID=1287737 RepID=A0A6S7EU53_9BURK|nr:LysR family transcriptional regulator [Achromobacter anxifer]MDF8361694.1 LysR family transcriptional regulator [Achromobacter anxifer]CAB3928388.1 HTH-type transcriptional regulator DmlR [Achromobacter anxifer]
MKRLHGMELFAEVAKAHSFSRAAAALGMPTSTVSRHVAELERAVGLRLLSRNTRRVELTDAGRLYFERCRRIVAEAEIAHEELRDQLEVPSGPLRVQLPAAYALDALIPALVAFGSRYPEIRLQMSVVGPEFAEHPPEIGDVSIRLGELPDSSLVARRLGTVHASLYASPAYLAARGAPTSPAELQRHDCIGLRTNAGQPAPWPLQRGRDQLLVPVEHRYGANDACMARQLAVLGAGIAALGGDESGRVRSGELARVLPAWSLGPIEVHAVTETRLLPAKTRRLIDFLGDYLDNPGLFLEPELPVRRAA